MSRLVDHLTAGVGYESVLAVLIGALTFLSLMSLWRLLIAERPRSLRIRAVARRGVEQGAGRQAQRSRRQERRQSPMALVLRRLRLAQAVQTEKITARLVRAGLRSREAVAGFMAAKLLCPVLLLSAATAALLALDEAFPSGLKLSLIVVSLLLGFFGPEIFLANRAAKRRQALQKALPDGLDLLVICAEAGLTMDAALHRVAEELAPASPDLADELIVTSVELNFLPERRLALLNLAKRVDLPALRGVVNTLIQTERYGTPLAHSLRVLSAEFREQRMLRAEEKAARLPATLTVPMIVFILPTLFVVLIGPAILGVLDQMTR